MLFLFLLLSLFVASPASALFETLAANNARDLGPLTCTEPVGNAGLGTDCRGIVAFSGMQIDDTAGKIYMFGGGHQATESDATLAFTLATNTWSNLTVPTPCAELVSTNWNASNTAWITTGHPATNHTYDLTVLTPTELVSLRQNGESPGGCWPADWSTFRGTGGFHHFDKATNTWTHSTNSSPFNAESAEYDPASGQIIVVGNAGLWTYDPVLKSSTKRVSFNISTQVYIDGNLVRHSPSGKMYFFTRPPAPATGPQSVWEVTLDRTTWASSTVTLVTGTTGTPPSVVGNASVGIAYDSVNDIFCGWVDRTRGIYCYKPDTKQWSYQTITREAGSTTFEIRAQEFTHALAYSPSTNVFIGVFQSTAGNPATNRTWAYRYAGSTPTPPAATTLAPITIENSTGSVQTSRIYSALHLFKQGDIPNCAHASIAGTPILTQCNVRNRWPDGSLKVAQLSFIIPLIPAPGNVVVSFFNDTTCNDTGGLSQGQMLAAGYNFDGTMEMTGSGTTRTISARTMLNAGAWRYYLQGPIVTAVIIEDRTLARTYDTDFGDGFKNLHPIYEAWFYPQGNQVELGYTIENSWVSNNINVTARAQDYSLVLKSGNTSPTTEYSFGLFTHIPHSNVYRHFWLGTDPPAIRIDKNTAYMQSTKLLPNWDMSFTIPEPTIADQYLTWTTCKFGTPSRVQSACDLDGQPGSNSAGGIGQYRKALDAPGTAEWHGQFNTWDIFYFYTYDNRMLEKVMGNADLAGRIPWQFREADTLAGSGDYFDAVTTGSVDTFGRVVSVNARRTTSLGDLANNCGGAQHALDRINAASYLKDNWSTTRDHIPPLFHAAYLITGKYHYLEGIQMEAAFVVAHKTGCYGSDFARQGEAGYFNDSQTRGDAWAFTELAIGATYSPDGSPEKAYFEDMLKNNLAMYEGIYGLVLTEPSKIAHYNWGRDTRRKNSNIFNGLPVPTLHYWQRGNAGFAQPICPTSAPCGNTPTANHGSFQEGFLNNSLGFLFDLGFPVRQLLEYGAMRSIHTVLDPAMTIYSSQIYAMGTTVIDPPGTPERNMATWAEFFATLLYPYQDGTTEWRTFENGSSGFEAADADEVHAYIMMAALAHFCDAQIVVDGYSACTAFTTIHTDIPHKEIFYAVKGSPKQSLMPRPTDTTPPPVTPSSLQVWQGGATHTGGATQQ